MRHIYHPDRNLWIVMKEPLGLWTAEIAIKRGERTILFEWLEQILQAGEEFDVYKVRELRPSPLDFKEGYLKNFDFDKVREITQPGYKHERDGSVLNFLWRVYEVTGNPEHLFKFENMSNINGTNNYVYGHVSYYEENGEVKESDVDSLGELLGKYYPDRINSIGTGLLTHHRPVDLWRTGSARPKQSEETYALAIQLFSDIWYPWVTGGLEDYNKDKGFFSNHELADRHPPRLNQFLQRVREVTLEFGGTFTLDREDSARNLLFMMSDDGINLEAELPIGIEELDSLSRVQYEMLKEQERLEIAEG